MPPDWKRIREKRQDLTDWVIHWTHRRYLGEYTYRWEFDVLKEILGCGYLIPSFAPRESTMGNGKERDTVKGPHPAVCFTDQPLGAFVRSCKALPSKYQPYGVALEKRNLFIYGGRPVIYGDDDLLQRLDDEDKFLWVRYSPVADQFQYKYPVDWTHEREWRARVGSCHHLDWGLTPVEGVPLVLPPQHIEGKFVISLPRIIVRSVKEAAELREWLAVLPPYEGANGFVRKFYAKISQVRIIPLDVVAARLKTGDSRWGRVETLPWDELSEALGAPS